MPATSYRIWGWGPSVDGTPDASHIGIAGIAKPVRPAYPMEVVNEIICGDLGRALRLPIPPGIVVIRETDRVLHHVSLNFSLTGEKLPPADATAIADNLPWLSCGVVMFDLWVGNTDRFEKNLAYDDSTKSLQLFDHGRALLCGPNGRKRLESLNDRALIQGHCLALELANLDGIEDWNDRIKSLPKYFIVDAVWDATKIGLTTEDAAFCTDFLIKRRSRLLRLVRKFRDDFHNAPRSLHGIDRGRR